MQKHKEEKNGICVAQSLSPKNGNASSIIEKSIKDVFQPLVEIEIIKSKITLSSKDVEKFYGIPESTLRTWRNRKKGPKFYQSEKGSPVIYTHEDIKGYLLCNSKGN